MELINKIKNNEKFDNNLFTVKNYKKISMVSFKETENYTKEQRQANGVLFKEKEVLHYSFEKCYDTRKDIYIPEGDETYDISLYFEGSVIKMFYHEESWKMSTSRGIDASTNFWISEKSFEELFKECVLFTNNCSYEEFLESLDKNSFYTFLMCHPEHGNNDTVPVYYTLTKVTLQENEDNTFSLKEELPDYENLLLRKDVSYEEIQKFLQEYRKMSSNFMIYVKKSNGEISRIKAITETTFRKTELAGKYPDIGISYLQYSGYYNDNVEKHEFYNIFPDFEDTFKKVDDLLEKTVCEIHNLYTSKHVFKSEEQIPEKYERTIYQLHSQFLRTKKKITKRCVEEKLNSLNVWLLAKLINYEKN